MVWLAVADDRNCIVLSEGTLQRPSVLEATVDTFTSSLDIDAPNFSNEDEMVVWVLLGVTRLVTLSLDYRAEKLPLDTWVLRRNDLGEGAFGDWFPTGPKADRYRLFLHRQPAMYEGNRIWQIFWPPAYQELGIRHRRAPSAPLMLPAIAVMTCILDAGRHDWTGAQELIRELGHPCVGYADSNKL